MYIVLSALYSKFELYMCAFLHFVFLYVRFTPHNFLCNVCFPMGILLTVLDCADTNVDNPMFRLKIHVLTLQLDCMV